MLRNARRRQICKDETAEYSQGKPEMGGRKLTGQEDDGHTEDMSRNKEEKRIRKWQKKTREGLEGAGHTPKQEKICFEQGIRTRRPARKVTRPP